MKLHSLFHFFISEKEMESTALMLAALEGDEIIVDILVACVSQTNMLGTILTLVAVWY